MLKSEMAAWLAKVGDNEEIFPLRAQDAVAANTVRYWAHAAAEAGAPTPKVNDAFATADRMEKHEPRKVPD